MLHEFLFWHTMQVELLASLKLTRRERGPSSPARVLRSLEFCIVAYAPLRFNKLYVM